MRRLLLSCLATVALAGALLGAAEDVVTHEATERKSAIAIPAKASLKLILPDLGDKDHTWQIIYEDPRFLKSTGEAKRRADAKAEKPVWEITFAGQLRKGRTTVRMMWAATGGISDVLKPDDLREVAVLLQ